ncbi:ATP-dependent Clp protease proteolytic subunit [Nitrospira defluvii]|nr:ATP-dependent Clp protease proteolytic subunit [Nitrospira defluvii]
MATKKEQTKKKGRRSSPPLSSNGKRGLKGIKAHSEDFCVSMYSSIDKLPKKFAESIKNIESLLEMPVWLVVQNGRGPWSNIGYELYMGFQKSKHRIKKGKPIALLIESPGGDAHYAYRIARILQRHTENNLTVVIPQFAKSAATLLALGAKNLILGRDAELGPLDVQLFDQDRESFGSALDAVQSLE